MPDPIMPGALWTPGALAGYQRGRTAMQFCVDHFTVGTNSYSVGARGYFHFLVNKEGPPNQFAEADALTWHAGPWNGYGPGIEWERLTTGGYVRPGLSNAEELTPDQILWGGRIIDFLAEWGIPAVHYTGPRFQAAGWHGHVNHGDIDDQRSDGLTEEEFAAMTFTLPPLPEPEEEDMGKVYITKQSDPSVGAWELAGNTRRHILIDEWNFDLLAARLNGKPPPVALPISDQWWDSIPEVTG